MATFTYKGRSARGESVTGELEGDSAAAIAARLFDNGVTPIDIAPAKRKSQVDLSEVWARFGGGRPKNSDLIMFSRQMYTIVKAGIPLIRGLRGLMTTTHNAVLRGALQDIVKELESGEGLAGSFARRGDVFSELYIAIIRVGETTGTLESAFLRLAEYLAMDQDVKDRVKSATRYPLIVLITIALAIGVITVFVIPNFAPLFRALGDDIPLPTRIILAISTNAQKYWHLALSAIVGATLLTRRYLRTERGRYKWHRAKLKLPVVGALTQQAILSRVSRSLAISLAAGMPMIQSLEIIAHSAGNDYLSECVMRLRVAMERGESLSQAASDVGVFPPLVLQMMSVGEETGDLSSLLEEVADFYQREVDYALKNISALIEPILVAFVGVAVLILALGVFLPLWNMFAKVGGGH